MLSSNAERSAVAPEHSLDDCNHAASSVGHLTRLDGCGSRKKAGRSGDAVDLLSEELDIAEDLIGRVGVDFSTEWPRIIASAKKSRGRIDGWDSPITTIGASPRCLHR